MTAIGKQKSWCIGLFGAVLALQSLTAMSRVPDMPAERPPSTSAGPAQHSFIFADDWGWH